jgi:hypothetical protein
MLGSVMKNTTHESLTNGSLIRVPGVLGKVSVCTLAAFAARYNEPVSKHEELDRKFGRETQYAWTMQHAAVLTADYPGKAEEHAREMAARAAAPLVNTGDVLVIDGIRYTAKVMGDYADPVHLTRA